MSIPTFNDLELMRVVRENVINPTVLKVNQLETNQIALTSQVNNFVGSNPLTYTGEIKDHELVAFDSATNTFKGSGVIAKDGSVKTAPGSVDLGPHRLSSSGENSIFTYLPTGVSYSPVWQTYSETNTERATDRIHSPLQQNVVRFSDTSQILTNPEFSFNVPENETLFRIKLNFTKAHTNFVMEVFRDGQPIWRNIFPSVSIGEQILKLNTPLDLKAGIHDIKFTCLEGDLTVRGDAFGNPYYSVWVRVFEDKEIALKSDIDELKATPYDDSHLMKIADYDSNGDGTVDEAASVKGVTDAGNDYYYGKSSTGDVGFHALPQGVSALGDMTKAVYDPDDNGTVSVAELAHEISGRTAEMTDHFYGVKGNITGWYPASHGDMTKAVYDADGDGIVDEARKVNGVSTAGSLKYYGTNGSSVPGFYTLPTSSDSTPPQSTVDEHILYQNIGWSPATGNFPSNARVGYLYQALNGGEVDRIQFDKGDWIVAIIENPSTVNYAGSWLRIANHNFVHSIMGVTGAIDSIQLKSILETIGVRFINEMESAKAYYGFTVADVSLEDTIKGLSGSANIMNAYREWVLTQSEGGFGYAVIAMPKNLGDKIHHVKIKGGLTNVWASQIVTIDSKPYKVFKSPFVFHNNSLTLITED